MKKIGLLLLALSASWSYATVYVNGEKGNDAQPGTAQQPVKTLQKAVILMRQKQDYALDIAKTTQPYYESLIFKNMTPPAGKRIYVNGNGATLSGLGRKVRWQKIGDNYFCRARRNRKAVYFAVLNGKILNFGKDLKAMKPLEVIWSKRGLYFRPEPGKTPQDYQIYGTSLESGVKLIDTSYVTVENLKCEFFANDGFNVHGSCYDLHFRNIEAAWNGDDGFSVHEDVGVSVTDGKFHHNGYGIQDVNVSRSWYHRVKVYENRINGVHFLGGYHALIDSEVCRNNRYEVLVQSYTAPHMKIPNASHLLGGETYVANCRIHSGKIGVAVKERGRVTLRHCRLEQLKQPQEPASSANIAIIK